MATRESSKATRSRRPTSVGGDEQSTAAAAMDRTAWRRDAEAQDVTSRLGQRVREHREWRGMSLNAASEATGIPGATISRIENNRMAPTFGLVLKIMKGLNITWMELMGPEPGAGEDGTASVSLPENQQSVRIRSSDYTSPHAESPLLNNLAPIIIETTARVLADVGGLIGHKGVEFCYVLAGTLVLHMAGRLPQTIPTGGSVLFNAEMPHAYLALGRKPLRLLITMTRDPMMPQDEATIFGQRSAARLD